MSVAEPFGVPGSHLVRESRKGVGRGVFQTRAAERRDDLITGNGHGITPVTDPGSGFLRPEPAIRGNQVPGLKLPGRGSE